MADQPSEVSECLSMMREMMGLIREEQATNRMLGEALTKISAEASEAWQGILFGRTGVTPQVQGQDQGVDPLAMERMSRAFGMEWDQAPTSPNDSSNPTSWPDPLGGILSREQEEEGEMLQQTLAHLRQYDPAYGFTPIDEMAREVATGSPNPFARIPSQPLSVEETQVRAQADQAQRDWVEMDGGLEPQRKSSPLTPR